MLCDKTFRGGDVTHTPDREGSYDWPPKVQIPPESNLLKKWVLLSLFTEVWVSGYLQEQKWLKDSCINKAYPTIGNSSQQLETRSTFQAAQ